MCEDLSGGLVTVARGVVSLVHYTGQNKSSSERAPKEAVQAVKFPSMDETSLVSIRIIGFGQCFDADKAPSSLGIPLLYFPLELYFDHPPSKISDMWAVACLVFEAQTWRFFEPMNFELLVGTLRFTLGPLSACWKDRYLEVYAMEGFRGEEPPEI